MCTQIHYTIEKSIKHGQVLGVCCTALQCIATCCSMLQCCAVCPHTHHTTGWRRLIACLKLQFNFCKRATNYRALLREMTHTNKPSYASSSPCIDKNLKCRLVLECCSALQFVAVCYSVLQCVAAWCNVLHCVPECIIQSTRASNVGRCLE